MSEAVFEQQLKGLANLLLLQQRLREARTESELGFLLVNDTHQLLNYRSAVLWLCDSNRARGGAVKNISGAVDHDTNSPYAQWMRSVCLDVSGTPAAGIREFRRPELSAELSNGWEKHGANILVWCPIYSAAGVLLGGLCLWRDAPLLEAEQRILSNWLAAAGYSLAALRGKAFAKRGFEWTGRRKQIAIAVTFLLSLLLFMPVRLSVLAQAEIVPRTPLVVRSPMDGIIEEIAVKPNMLVEQGAELIKLDDTALQTRLAVSEQTLSISRAQYQQASQAASFDRDAKSSLRVLALEIEKREAEVAYVNSLIARSAIKADRKGLIIMPSPNEMIGKPVTTGERLLTIADPGDAQLEAWLPVGDDIRLDNGARVEFFPNVSPEKRFTAYLESMDYRAEQTETGELAYRIRAEFDEKTQVPRIGMRGTAKLYGDKVSLGYFLFRRPLSTLRRWVGY